MKKHHLETLISNNDITARIKEMGQEITQYYKKQDVKELIIVGLLKGSFMFMADLVRAIDLPQNLDFIQTSSYGVNTVSSKEIKISKDIAFNIQDKDVLIIEDIFDTGYTLDKIINILNIRKPKSLKICTLLSKPERREVEVNVDWVGFTIPNVFIVGYGSDYAEYYRNLDYVASVVMEEE